jgi:hypothetical protein
MKKNVFLVVVAFVLASGLTGCVSAKKDIVYKEIPLSELVHTTQRLRNLANAGNYYFIVEAYFSFVSGSIKMTESPDEWDENAEKFRNNSPYSEQLRYLASDYTKYPNLKGLNNLEERIDFRKPYKIWLRVEHRGQYEVYSIPDKIEGIRTLEEATERIVENAGYILADWSKAFATKEAVQNWLDDIGSRAKDVDDVVKARKELYEGSVSTFKTYPSKLFLDTMTKNKNNLTEGYNRYKLINTEIEGILSKGSFFERSLGENINYPGLREKALNAKIDALNKEYAKLVDTYPVN